MKNQMLEDLREVLAAWKGIPSADSMESAQAYCDYDCLAHRWYRNHGQQLESMLSAEPVGDLEIAEAAMQRFHDKFMERANIDPSTGYPEYGGQEDYYTDLCTALDAVKALQDVPADPRETGLSGDEP